MNNDLHKGPSFKVGKYKFHTEYSDNPNRGWVCSCDKYTIIFGSTGTLPMQSMIEGMAAFKLERLGLYSKKTSPAKSIEQPKEDAKEVVDKKI